MQQVLDQTLLPISQPAWLLGGFASIALLLAATGLYGLMSHSVAQRRREIGIRMALGARSGDVLWEVLRDGVMMLLPGAGFGLIGAFALTRIMTSLLFEVSPLDPVALAIIVSFVAVPFVRGLRRDLSHIILEREPLYFFGRERASVEANILVARLA